VKALVIMSGGLDSVVLDYLMRAKGDELEVLNADWGQAGVKELGFARRANRAAPPRGDTRQSRPRRVRTGLARTRTDRGADGCAGQPVRPAEEKFMAIEMARGLQRYGVNFAGLDIVYPYLLEVNLCNPGGIQNAPASRMDDLVARVLDAILLRFSHRSE
jgi:glutathione synthetase-like protein/queuosine biosynthesis protein QueC